MTSTRERRVAAGTLGLLAATLLVAGGLPWLGGGPVAVRLIALPLLLLGAAAAVAAARLPGMPPPLRRMVRPAARPAARPAGAHQCERCSCAAEPPAGTAT